MGSIGTRKPDQPAPRVSVIVPVLNGEEVIGALLDSLTLLDYPRDRLQVIIVDNGSSDRTREVVARYPFELREETQVRSSYAARNRGIEVADGEIIAFTDADCRVSTDWITEGIKTMLETSAALVGGRVQFEFSEDRTTAELFDSLTNMHTRRTIALASYAATANLFVRASLFRELGRFQESVVSGGDVQWTQEATRQGHSLVYSADAVVHHPARCLPEILEKNYRVGSGLIPLFRNAGRTRVYVAAQALRRALPPMLADVCRIAQEDGVDELSHWSPKLFAIAYASNLANLAGMCSYLFDRRTSRGTS